MRLKAGGSPLSVERVLNTLRSIQLHRVKLDGRSLRGLTAMSPEQLVLFDNLEVSRPVERAL